MDVDSEHDKSFFILVSYLTHRAACVNNGKLSFLNKGPDSVLRVSVWVQNGFFMSMLESHWTADVRGGRVLSYGAL